MPEKPDNPPPPPPPPGQPPVPGPAPTPGPLPVSTPSPSAPIPTAEETRKSVEKFVNNALDSINKAAEANASEATISAQKGPAIPYIPGQEKPEPDLHGATREDFPPDYTIFDPQTGTFGESVD